MRPRKVKHGDTVYEMRARKNGSQTPAPGQAVSLPNEAPSRPPTARLGIPLPALVAGEHVKALRKVGVPFEDLTESPLKHGKAAAG